MSDAYPYAWLLLLVAVVGFVALLSNRLTQRVRIPATLLILATAAVAVTIPALHSPPEQLVDRLVTAALIFILFDGGMGIGWARFRSAARPIAVVGIVGTLLTAAVAALVLHLIFGLGGQLVSVTGVTTLHAGDEALVLADPAPELACAATSNWTKPDSRLGPCLHRAPDAGAEMFRGAGYTASAWAWCSSTRSNGHSFAICWMSSDPTLPPS